MSLALARPIIPTFNYLVPVLEISPPTRKILARGLKTNTNIQDRKKHNFFIVSQYHGRFNPGEGGGGEGTPIDN